MTTYTDYMFMDVSHDRSIYLSIYLSIYCTVCVLTSPSGEPLANLYEAIVVPCHLSKSKEITGKFPGYLSPSAGLKFADVPNGLAAISKVPAAGWGRLCSFLCLFLNE